MATRARERHVVALLGRFGNQLFQYSFARWLEQETHREVRLDLSMTRNVGIAGSDELVRAVNSRAVRGSRGFPAPGGRFGPLGGHLRQALGPRRVVIDVTASGADQEDFATPSWWVGYWQQLRFAEAARDELRQLLGISPGGGDRGRQRIAVHVRRGDYVGLGLALSPGWYRSALESALGVAGDAEVLVVSDDPGWCRRHLQLGHPFSLATGGTAMEDFRALAHADVMVASASTFSWWAGYLGGRTVICPDQGPSGPDLPTGWMTLPRVESPSGTGGAEG